MQNLPFHFSAKVISVYIELTFTFCIIILSLWVLTKEKIMNNKRKNKKNTNLYKHLTLEDRNKIEEELNQGASFRQIATLLNKDPSTISKEVKRNFTTVKPSSFNNSFNRCEFKRTCKQKNVCGKNCDDYCKNCIKCNELCCNYTPMQPCIKLNKPPYVCNGCLNRQGCRKDKFIYKSKEADIMYHDLLISARQGINKTEEELKRISSIVVPLVKQRSFYGCNLNE